MTGSCLHVCDSTGVEAMKEAGMKIQDIHDHMLRENMMVQQTDRKLLRSVLKLGAAVLPGMSNVSDTFLAVCLSVQRWGSTECGAYIAAWTCKIETVVDARAARVVCD